MLNIKGKARIKDIAIVISVVILLYIGTGIAISYIASQTQPVENDFESGKVECLVNETFDGLEKKDVSIRNTGNTLAYVRVAVVVTWQSYSNADEILAKTPEEAVDYSIVFGDSRWVKGDDGYWYYVEPILPNTDTTTLIKSITPLVEAPEGYFLSVDILASAIQAEPISVVKDAWGVTAVEDVINP